MKLSRFLRPTLLFILASDLAYGGSATWDLNPINSDWNTAANWTPDTVPNGSHDVATFALSNQTDLTLSAQVTVDRIVFAPGATAYTINAAQFSTILGSGIVNRSGVMQTFSAPFTNGIHGGLSFKNRASAGDLTTYALTGGDLIFNDNSSAGGSTLIAGSDGTQQGTVIFFNNSTAGDSQIVVEGGSFGAFVSFSDDSTAGHANISLQSAAGGGLGGVVTFNGSGSADQSTIVAEGGSADGASAGSLVFREASTVGEASLTLGGASAPGTQAASALLIEKATAADAVITLNGGSASGAAGAVMTFDESTRAGAATFSVSGGSAGGEGGVLQFEGRSVGDTARVIVSGNGELDLSNRSPIAPTTFTLGSVEGDGLVLLGVSTLALGGSDLDMLFSGLIEGEGVLQKVGRGTLTLSGANSYSGGSTINDGTFLASNSDGSATGSGPVQVNAGTLGGSGLIAGAVTIGTGSGSGSLLAPAAGSNKQEVLTIQSALTLQSDGTYACTINGRRNQLRVDKVFANGVTIDGATFSLSGRAQGHLSQGFTFTVINNTAATPINGTFANLPDGGVVALDGNNFQADYEGGDGNDLTLTVVP